jgi:hypothetical protein
MAGLTEFYCRLNETSHASQLKWLEYTFNALGKKHRPIAHRMIVVSFSYPVYNKARETIFEQNLRGKSSRILSIR